MSFGTMTVSDVDPRQVLAAGEEPLCELLRVLFGHEGVDHDGVAVA